MNKRQNERNVMKPTDAAGFSLVEVMIALLIFSFGIMALWSLQYSSTIENANSRRVSEANIWATHLMERYMAIPWDATDPRWPLLADTAGVDVPMGPVDPNIGAQTAAPYTFTVRVADDAAPPTMKTITIAVNSMALASRANQQNYAITALKVRSW